MLLNYPSTCELDEQFHASYAQIRIVMFLNRKDLDTRKLHNPLLVGIPKTI